MIRAFFKDRRGHQCIRPVANAVEAEKILTGGYGAQECVLRDDQDREVGKRERADDMDDGRFKWRWYFDTDAFVPSA